MIRRPASSRAITDAFFAAHPELAEERAVCKRLQVRYTTVTGEVKGDIEEARAAFARIAAFNATLEAHGIRAVQLVIPSGIL